MAKSYTVKGPGTSRSTIIVSDQDAHWLNAYRYIVSSGGRLQAKRRDSAKSCEINLTTDIFGKGVQVLHINGNPLDFRRSNCTIMTPADKARLMLLDEKIGCSFSPRRNFKAKASNV